MKPYRSSGETDDGALLALLVTVLVTALVVGVVANFIGQWIRLLIVFPAAMGGLVGAAALQVALFKKMRTPLLVIGVAAFGGLLCWFTDFGIEYWRTRGDIRSGVAWVAAEVEAQGLGVPDEAAIERTIDVVLQYGAKEWEVTDLVIAVHLLDEPLSDATGAFLEPSPDPDAWEAFVAYVQSQAAMGTTISDVGRADEGNNIGAIGTYLLWILELLIVIAVAGGLAWEQVRQPFCERCKGWFDRKERIVAVAHGSQAAEVVGAMEAGRTDGLARAWKPFDADGPFIAVGIRACPKCSSGPRYVDIVRMKIKGGKAKRKSLRKGLVEAGKLEAQLEALTAHAAEALASEPTIQNP